MAVNRVPSGWFLWGGEIEQLIGCGENWPPFSIFNHPLCQVDFWHIIAVFCYSTFCYQFDFIFQGFLEFLPYLYIPPCVWPGTGIYEVLTKNFACGKIMPCSGTRVQSTTPRRKGRACTLKIECDITGRAIQPLGGRQAIQRSTVVPRMTPERLKQFPPLCQT